LERLYARGTVWHIERSNKKEDALRVVRKNFVESHQVFGTALNAATKSPRGHMMSIPANCKAQIEISFKSIKLSGSGNLAKCIYAAISTDTKSHEAQASDPETKITLINDERTNSSILLELESPDIPALRATINSYLRLIDASLKICEESVINSR
jgi:tRNA threonylcarbamoyladenosine modification (KEOPS) complex  Pcc1 subunit